MKIRKATVSLLILSLIFVSLTPTASAIPDPEESVIGYLSAVGEGDANTAYTYVYFNQTTLLKFGYPKTNIELRIENLKNKYKNYAIENITILDRELSEEGMQAVLKVSFDIMRDEEVVESKE